MAMEYHKKKKKYLKHFFGVACCLLFLPPWTTELISASKETAKTVCYQSIFISSVSSGYLKHSLKKIALMMPFPY
jgi:hypothetical protein